MTDFRVDIRNHNDTKLKITWAHSIPFLAYFVNYGSIKKVAERIRDTLSKLVNECLENPDAGSLNTAPLLRELAVHGRALWEELFKEAGGSEQDPDLVLGYFNKYPDARVTVSVDETVHIPWGLIYDGDPESLPVAEGRPDPAVYRDFWALKHRLSTIFYRITPDRVAAAIPGEKLRLLPIIHKEVFGKARAELKLDWSGWLDWMLTNHQPAFSSSEFKQRWKEAAADIGLLYFYCHASGAKLEFGTDDQIEADQLGREFARAARSLPKRDWSCLLFLNGCSTATGDPAGAFLEAAGEAGMCGFIGTEAEVPDIFALRFSLEFLYLFLRGGKSLDEVMADARVRHFPLSLLYSVYTYPLVQIAATAPSGPELKLGDDNYSFGKIGSSTL